MKKLNIRMRSGFVHKLDIQTLSDWESLIEIVETMEEANPSGTLNFPGDNNIEVTIRISEIESLEVQRA